MNDGLAGEFVWGWRGEHLRRREMCRICGNWKMRGRDLYEEGEGVHREWVGGGGWNS